MIRKRILPLAILLSMALGAAAPLSAIAATSNVSVTSTAYTSIAGPGAVAATVTASRDIQYEFSATAPGPGVYGHKLIAGQSIPLSSMGSGIYMWIKGEVEAATVAITYVADATINNGAAGGGGSTALLALESGGNLQTIAGSVSSAGSSPLNPIGVQGVTGGYSLLGGSLYNSSAPTFTSGQQAPFQADSSGNLKVNIAAGAASGAVAQGSTTASQTGSLTQGAVTTSAPTYTTAQTSPFSLNTSGGLRVDGSGVTQPVSAASLPLPSGAAISSKQAALGTAGTASSDVLSVQGIASMTALKVDGSAVTQPVSNSAEATSLSTLITQTAITPYKTVTGQSGVGAITAVTSPCSSGAGCNLLDSTASGVWTDVRGFGTPEMLFLPTSTLTGGTITFETAVDSNGTGSQVATCIFNGVNTGATSGTSFNPSASGLYKVSCPLTLGYLRARVSTSITVSSGNSISAYVYSTQANPLYQLSLQSGTWTVQPGNTANTTPWLITPAAGTTGGYTTSNMTTATTTTQKSGAGTLHTISVGTKGVTSNLICYDNTSASGTKLTGTIDTTLSTESFVFDAAFTTGLTCITTGGTPADILITYK